ncbi:peptide chain release factor N(5)-glutamine methyltransferase [Aureimonas sp. AU12]|uniref:peptide chain release factor N(5)-glutamine methyltransferase n=1 Tax=Aureimonas sp. AU12 TaxID=1638161 RepID=UPI000A9F1BEA|nr:peptide chain release factor N(5)-glutamine methyltransferase [Aureimonas sp. AU12]
MPPSAPEPGAAGASVADCLAGLRQRFRTASLATPDLDARLLVGAALELDAAGLILRAADPVSPEVAARLDAMARRRLAGEPVHRILGRRFFFDHEFALSPETLEPRPDTEILVALTDRAFRIAEAESDRPLVFADIGTGTGAIGVSLLAMQSRRRCLAVDIAEEALTTARINAAAAGVGERFLPLRSDYLSAVGAGTLDAVVSNPPYIPSRDIDGLDVEVRRFDPMLALDGGADGLSAYRRIAAEAAFCLRPGGDLLLEIGIGQEGDVGIICRAAGFELVAGEVDLGQILRALWFRRDNSSEFRP